MKGVVFLGDRKLELREFPDPTPGPRDAILEIKASGMCGSASGRFGVSALPPRVLASLRSLLGRRRIASPRGSGARQLRC